MKRTGFTLIELILVASLLIVVMGAIYQVWFGIGDTTRLLEAKATASDEALRGLARIVREFRQASKDSFSPLPAAHVSYQIAEDRDGNGFAVGVRGNLELSLPRQVRRDFDDINGDGLSEVQLVLVSGERAEVLANGLIPDEDSNGNGVLDQGEDRDNDGRMDRGVWFTRDEGRVCVTIQTQQKTRKGYVVVSRYVQVVAPRN